MEATARKRTWMPTVAGTLDIISGVFSLLCALASIVAVIAVALISEASFLEDMRAALAEASIGSEFLVAILAVTAVWMAAAGILALLGGIYSIQRRKWGLTLAGSIAAILGGWTVLGILATIFAAISKNEFE